MSADMASKQWYNRVIQSDPIRFRCYDMRAGRKRRWLVPIPGRFAAIKTITTIKSFLSQQRPGPMLISRFGLAVSKVTNPRRNKICARSVAGHSLHMTRWRWTLEHLNTWTLEHWNTWRLIAASPNDGISHTPGEMKNEINISHM